MNDLWPTVFKSHNYEYGFKKVYHPNLLSGALFHLIKMKTMLATYKPLILISTDPLMTFGPHTFHYTIYYTIFAKNDDF